MALTAIPLFLVYSASGLDNYTSGAGPIPAVSGSLAAYTTSSGTTINFSNNPDLSNIAQDGSHVLYLNTPSGRAFSRISTVDNSAKTVVVQDTFLIGSGNPVDYGIGGYIGAIGTTRASKLLARGASPGDLDVPMTIRFLSGHYEAFTTQIGIRSRGNIDSGAIILEGEAGAAVIPTLNASGVSGFNTMQNRAIFRNFKIINSVANKSTFGAFTANSANNLNIEFDGLIIGDSGNLGFANAFSLNDVNAVVLKNCELKYNKNAITIAATTQSWLILNNYIHHNGPNQAVVFNNTTNGRVTMLNNIIIDNSGTGIDFTGAIPYVILQGNTIAANSGNGINFNNNLDYTFCFNNIVANNVGAGVNINAVQPSSIMTNGLCEFFGNVFFGNGSGNFVPSGMILNNIGSTNYFGIDPGFNNTAIDDYRIGTRLAGSGYPQNRTGYAFPGYIDPGALQRQETSSSGTTINNYYGVARSRILGGL